MVFCGTRGVGEAGGGRGQSTSAQVLVVHTGNLDQGVIEQVDATPPSGKCDHSVESVDRPICLFIDHPLEVLRASVDLKKASPSCDVRNFQGSRVLAHVTPLHCRRTPEFHQRSRRERNDCQNTERMIPSLQANFQPSA